MKRLYLVLFILTGFLAFGDTEEQEVDYLLFLPNSGNEFVDQEQAMLQLDNMANYLKGRNLVPGQIHVYGYSANFANDIDSVTISRDRALFVISELEKRGVANDLFAAPVGRGEADTWGYNPEEYDMGRGPNRRVIVMLDGNAVTPQIMQEVEPELDIEETVVEETFVEETVVTVVKEDSTEKQKSKFPWWIFLLILLLLLLLIVLLSAKKKKRSPTVTPAALPTVTPAVMPQAPPQETAEPVIAAAPVFVPAATSEKIVNLEEEILFRSYELYLQHKDQYIDVDGDWHRAVCDVSARYEADGWQVYRENWYWWARKTFVQ
jgi:hypothetical protein